MNKRKKKLTLRETINKADELANKAQDEAKTSYQIKQLEKAARHYKSAYRFTSITSAEKLEITQGLVLCYEEIIELTKKDNKEQKFSSKIIALLIGDKKVIDIEKVDDVLFVRTYERGVEDDTFSCGSGVVASALVAAVLSLSTEKNKCTIKTLGGNLEVSFDKVLEHNFYNIWLKGAATFVYKGVIETSSLVFFNGE